MTPAEAYHVLQLEPGAGREQIEQHHAEQKQILREKRARAQAPGLKAHIQQGLARVDTAREVLLHRLDLSSGAARSRRGGGQDSPAGPAARGGRSVTAADVDAVVDRLPRRLSRHTEGLARALLAGLAGAGTGAALISLSVVSADNRAMVVEGCSLVGLIPGLLWWRATVGRMRRDEWVKVREALTRGETRPVAWQRSALRLALALLLLLAAGVGYRRWTPAFPPASEELVAGPGRDDADRAGVSEPGPVAAAREPRTATPGAPGREDSGLANAGSEGGEARMRPEILASRAPPKPSAAETGEPGPEPTFASPPSSAPAGANAAETTPQGVAAAPPALGPRLPEKSASGEKAQVPEDRPARVPGTTGMSPAAALAAAGGSGARADPASASLPSSAPPRAGGGSDPEGPAWRRSAAVARAEAAQASEGDTAATRAGLARAYHAWAAELRAAKQSGLALYALDRAAAAGGADAALAATLRREFTAAHALVVEQSPPRVRIAPESGWPGATAEAEAWGAALDRSLQDSLDSALPPLVVLAPTERETGRDPSRPRLVLCVEAAATEEPGTTVASEDPLLDVVSASSSPGTRRLTLSAAVVLTRGDRVEDEEDEVLVKVTTTRSLGSARADELTETERDALRAALAEELQVRLRARRFELLTNLADATLALAQGRRAALSGEEPEAPGNLEWGWFAIWTEAGLPLPQHEAERAARLALALPEAVATGP